MPAKVERIRLSSLGGPGRSNVAVGVAATKAPSFGCDDLGGAICRHVW
jgi:hypothetical protein